MISVKAGHADISCAVYCSGSLTFAGGTSTLTGADAACIDDQQRDNQNVARIAPRNAVGVAGEKGEGDEENRRRKHLQHEYLLEIEVIAREGDVERKIRSEKHIGENQVEIIARFTHEKTIQQLSHHPA